MPFIEKIGCIIFGAAVVCAGQITAQTPPQTTALCEGNDWTIQKSDVIPLVPDVQFSKPATADNRQCAFDVYSWELFMALNRDATSGGPMTRWESWPESSDIFLKNGATPTGEPEKLFPEREIPKACEGLSDSKIVIRQIGKRPDVLEEFSEPFQSGPLIDAHGRYSRFAIYTNWPMFDYILSNQLYNTQGQQSFAQAGNSVVFPCSCVADPQSPKDSPCAQDVLGAIMVKAAWKVLDPKLDDASTFYATEALVYTEGTDGAPDQCVAEQMGLTGLHIAQKNSNDPQWLWSTFEHVANVPDKDATSFDDAYNYYIPDCEDCADVNAPPPQPWDPNTVVTDDARKSQVMRVTPVTANAESLNAAVQGNLLNGTVWENYHLISTQWPSNGGKSDPQPDEFVNMCSPANPVDPSGAPIPPFLANATLETYIQGTVPQASSTCINCHLNATDTTAAFSDFTFLLERAQEAKQ